MKNTVIDAPKMFREMNDIDIENVEINDADEIFWRCNRINVKNLKLHGLAPRNYLLSRAAVADQYDCGAGKEFSHSLYRSSGACIVSASELFFDIFHAGNQNKI